VLSRAKPGDSSVNFDTHCLGSLFLGAFDTFVAVDVAASRLRAKVLKSIR